MYDWRTCALFVLPFKIKYQELWGDYSDLVLRWDGSYVEAEEGVYVCLTNATSSLVAEEELKLHFNKVAQQNRCWAKSSVEETVLPKRF